MSSKLSHLNEGHQFWRLSKLAVLFFLLVAMFLVPWKAHAQTTIKLVSSSVTSEFPDGIRFKAEASSSQPITEIRVNITKGVSSISSYDYLQFDKGPDVKGELLFRTDTSARYMPPGTPVKYYFEIQDAAGNKLTTETQTFIYTDSRFQWEEVSKGTIIVAYHGPVKARAELVMDAMLQTIDKMGPILGVTLHEIVRVNMYNNSVEMLKALPPRSTTVSSELVTEGMAFADVGVILVLGSGTLAKGTASHEFTHILVDRATKNPFRGVPAWLNEGLAEYGNIDPGFDYDRALEFAIATNRLMPIIFLDTPPSTPEDIIIFYGQGRSIVHYLVETYGAAKMKQLMAEFKSGKSVDDAFKAAYGFDRQGLDTQWRKYVGAQPYTPPATNAPLPTPPPLPTFLPYSLTPQPGSTSPASSSTEPIATPVNSTPPASKSSGGSCSGPISGSNPGVDASLVALLLGLVGMGIATRRRK